MLSDVNGICRLCLKCDGTIIPIFGRENTSRDCIHLSKKILDCVSVKVKVANFLVYSPRSSTIVRIIII